MGGPDDAVVTGAALLLDLDDADAGAVAAEAAVLSGAAVTGRAVDSGRRVAAAELLLVSMHLQQQTHTHTHSFNCVNKETNYETRTVSKFQRSVGPSSGDPVPVETEEETVECWWTGDAESAGPDGLFLFRTRGPHAVCLRVSTPQLSQTFPTDACLLKTMFCLFFLFVLLHFLHSLW